MAMALSRQELEALVGSGTGKRWESADDTALDKFSQRVAECLEALLGTFGQYGPGKRVVSNWDELPQAMSVPAGTRLVLVETRPSSSELSVFVVTTSLTAYHLDEMANRTHESAHARAPFAAWRQVIEYTITESMAAVGVPGKSHRVMWQSLSPRRWDIGASDSEESGITDGDGQIVVIPFHSAEDKNRALYVLMPVGTLAQLSPVDDPTTAKAIEAPCSPPAIPSLVAEIPLSISVVVPAAQLTVRGVALWEIGSVVPVVLAPDQSVRLQVNDHSLAMGTLAMRDDGSLVVKITSLLT